MTSIDKFARRLARVERDIFNGAVKPRLANSSIDGGALTLRDPHGNDAGFIGQQFDGTITAAAVGGTTPASPTMPLVTPVIGGLRIYWDGTYVDGSVTRMDFQRVTFHAVTDVEDLDVLDAAQIVGEVTIATGAEVSVSLPPVEHFVVGVTWTNAGKFSVESDFSFGTPIVAVDPAMWAGHEAALDNLNNVALPALEDDIEANAAAINTLQTVTIPGLQTDLDANEAAVATLQGTTLPALQAELDASQVDITARARVIFNTTQPTGLTAADRVVWYDSDNGNSASYWNGSSWGPYTIGSGAITDGAIVTAKIGTDAVDSSKIAANAVTASEIAAGAVTANKLSVLVGGGNMVKNSSFENATSYQTDWVLNNATTTTPSKSTTIKFRGAGSLKLVNTAAGQDTYYAQTIVDVLPSTKYTLSAWVYVESITAGAVSNRTIAAFSDGVFVVDTSLVPGHATGVWTRKQLTITTGPAATTASIRLMAPQGTIYWDAIQFEQGDVATAYNPKTDEILPGTITAAQIAANTITAGQIATDTITATQLAAGAVTASEIATDAVTAGKIQAGAVTAGKIAADVVTATEIAANAITASEIQADAVTTAKIAAGAVTADEIGANAVTAVKIDADAVTAGKIAAGAVTTEKLAAGAVTANEIAAGTITADEIAGDYIYAGAVAADQIQTGDLNATVAVVGELTTAGSGRRVSMSSAHGIRAIDPSGAVVAHIPTDLDTDISMQADLVAKSVTALGSVAMRAADNELAQNSTLILRTASAAPVTSPIVSIEWTTVARGATEFQDWPKTGSYHAGSDRVYQAVTVWGAGSVQWLNASTGAYIDSFYITDPDESANCWSAARYGDRIYCMLRRDDGQWFIRFFDATTEAKLGEYNIGNDGSWAANPAMTIDASGNLVIVFPLPAPDLGDLRRQSYNRDTGAYLGGVDLALNAPGDVTALYVGPADTGITGVWFQTSTYPGSFFCFDYTTGARYLNLEFSVAYGQRAAALWWDTGRGFTSYSAITGDWHRYDGTNWTGGESSTWYVTNTWRDSDSGGTGLHETKQGPHTTLQMKKRARLAITTPPIPSDANGANLDDPNAVSIYVGRVDGGYTTQWRQAAPADGVRNVVLGSVVFNNTDTLHPNPPAAGNFPSSTPARITDATGAYYLDGNGDAVLKSLSATGRVYGETETHTPTGQWSSNGLVAYRSGKTVTIIVNVTPTSNKAAAVAIADLLPVGWRIPGTVYFEGMDGATGADVKLFVAPDGKVAHVGARTSGQQTVGGFTYVVL